MLRTSLVLFPDKDGCFLKSFHIAKEYYRVVYGLFRENNSTGVFTIASNSNLINTDKDENEFKQPQNVPPDKDMSKSIRSSLDAAVKHLEKKKFSTFYVGRIVLIFSDTCFMSAFFNEEAPIEENINKIREMARILLDDKLPDFDKMFIDVIMYHETILYNDDPSIETSQSEENCSISVYMINDLFAISQILKTKLGLSSIETTNGFYALFKKHDECHDIHIDYKQPDAIVYSDKFGINPLITFSTNLVLCIRDPQIYQIIINDFATKVLTFNQSLMISMNKTTGFRLSYIKSSKIDIHPSYFFDKQPKEPGLYDFYMMLPTLLNLSPQQPGFCIKRGEPNPVISRFLSLSTNQNVLLLSRAISQSLVINKLSGAVLGSILSPNININKTNTAQAALREIVGLATRNDATTEEFKKELAKADPNMTIKVLLNAYQVIAKAFEDLTPSHKKSLDSIVEAQQFV